MTLMIVDDNQKIRQVIKELFAGEFDEFVECSSGKEAVTSYEKYHPDWILMDIKMKGMSGIKATEEIKKQHPEAKIIIVTNHNDEDFISQAKKAGAIKYFRKENLTVVPDFIRDYDEVNYGIK